MTWFRNQTPDWERLRDEGEIERFIADH
jgi:hypothetical protein